MATVAQIKANRQNAQKSSGPTSDAGKKKSSMNNIRHGLTGHPFFLLDWEEPEAYEALKNDLTHEYQPQTPTENILVEKMAQQHWLSQRAQALQTMLVTDENFNDRMQKDMEALLRYQITHDRLFQRALHDLLKLRAERRKEQIGFESQERSNANETRKAETHKLKTAILETRLLSQNRDRQGADHCPNQPKTDQRPAETQAATQPIAA